MTDIDTTKRTVEEAIEDGRSLAEIEALQEEWNAYNRQEAHRVLMDTRNPALNSLHRRPEIVRITDPESLRVLHEVASRLVLTASPNCCANTTPKDDGKAQTAEAPRRAPLDP